MAKSLSNIIRAGSPSTPLPISFGGTGTTSLTSGSLLKGSGTGAITTATAGTDYVAPSGALGTPASGNLANCTGYPYANLSGTAPGSTPDFLLLNLGII